MDNLLAQQHYLSASDQNFFKLKVKEINDRLIRICNENDLKGNWTISGDYKWLVKTEDK